MAKKVDIYEEALERIRDEVGVPGYAPDQIAIVALEQGYAESGEDRDAVNLRVKEFMLTKGLIFCTAQELADAMNEAKMTSVRGKAWTRATATRILTDVRGMIEADLKKPANIPALVETTILPVEQFEAFAAAVTAVEEPEPVLVAELAQPVSPPDFDLSELDEPHLPSGANISEDDLADLDNLVLQNA